MHVNIDRIIFLKFIVKFSELLIGGSSDKINVSDIVQSFQLVLKSVYFLYIIINLSLLLVMKLRMIVCCGMRESSLQLWMVTSK